MDYRQLQRVTKRVIFRGERRQYICYVDRTSKREDESLVNFEVTLPFGLCGKHIYRSRIKS